MLYTPCPPSKKSSYHTHIHTNTPVDVGTGQLKATLAGKLACSVMQQIAITGEPFTGGYKY